MYFSHHHLGVCLAREFLHIDIINQDKPRNEGFIPDLILRGLEFKYQGLYNFCISKSFQNYSNTTSLFARRSSYIQPATSFYTRVGLWLAHEVRQTLRFDALSRLKLNIKHKKFNKPEYQLTFVFQVRLLWANRSSQPLGDFGNKVSTTWHHMLKLRQPSPPWSTWLDWLLAIISWTRVTPITSSNTEMYKKLLV